jgi:FkbM family methyltransferase
MFKETVVQLLPRPWVHFLKKLYFPRVLRNVSESDWPYSYIVRELVTPGGYAVDVGANIGYVSALLSRYVGSSGRVFSFEPVPETFDLLTHSLLKSGIKNVEAACFAASSADGEAVMEIPRFPDGGDNLYQSHIVSNNSKQNQMRTVRVRLRPLDDLLATVLNTIQFLKIDVEGHELEVIKGALLLIRGSHPALLIEVSGDPDSSGSPAHELFKLLADEGYSAYLLDKGKVRSRSPGEQSVDYFFLNSVHVDHLTAAGSMQSNAP